MLVLSRKQDEAIIIGDDILVVVVDISSDKVRLGIEYPNGCSVKRREVYNALHRIDEPASSAVILEVPAVNALAKIRRGISSPHLSDSELIAAILESVAAKDVIAADLKNFKEKL